MNVKVAVVGHHTWFSNHFPENWKHDPFIKCFDVDETDYKFLIYVANFRPKITLFYRPELYPKRFLDAIPGKKIAFLSEPLPAFENGNWNRSEETDLRLLVYKNMCWDSFDKVFYYDESKHKAVKQLGWMVNGIRPLPIDTSVFYPPRAQRRRPIDICFVGKATSHRIQQLDFLRLSPLRFVWIAHGISARELAEVFKRSKVVLNIHADGLPALEPRIYLAAACGCCVLTECLPQKPTLMAERVLEYHGDLANFAIEKAVRYFDELGSDWALSDDHIKLSVRRFLNSLL